MTAKFKGQRVSFVAAIQGAHPHRPNSSDPCDQAGLIPGISLIWPHASTSIIRIPSVKA